jgi:hypothetical protein
MDKTDKMENFIKNNNEKYFDNRRSRVYRPRI